MLILTGESRNHSVNSPVCLKFCENINPLNVHSVTFKIEVVTCGAIYMLYVSYNVDSTTFFIYKIKLLTDPAFFIKPRGHSIYWFCTRALTAESKMWRC